MTNNLLPPDVAEYLIESAVRILRESGKIPESLDECHDMLTDNEPQIVQGAQDAMAEMFSKFLKRQDEITEIMSDRVYNGIHARYPNMPESIQPRYQQWLDETGRTMDEMRGQSQVDYLCWAMDPKPGRD